MYFRCTIHRIIFDVLSFDELQFDVKSSPFEQLKNTSNKIRGIVFSVIDVFYVKKHNFISHIITIHMILSICVTYCNHKKHPEEKAHRSPK